MFNFSGSRPDNLGVNNGTLAPCPGTPNCVNSQSNDEKAKINPLPAVPISRIKAVVESMDRTKIITETNDYLHAEFASKLMGFVDDVEFYLDNGAGVVHVRSASRLGQSDLGVNRSRVEKIRAELA